jgi:hypothetical protein
LLIIAAADREQANLVAVVQVLQEWVNMKKKNIKLLALEAIVVAVRNVIFGGIHSLLNGSQILVVVMLTV